MMMAVMVVVEIASMDSGKIRTLLLLLLLWCSLRDSAAQGQYRVLLRQLSSQLPTPLSVRGGFRPGFQRIILSVGLGVLTGLIGALLFVCLVRSFVHYMSRTPVLRGPVIFSPKISPKTLLTALEDESESLGSSQGGRYRRAVLDNGLTVAVKRVELGDPGLPDKPQRKSVGRRVQKELEVLAGLRHSNLMSLRAYLCEPEQNRVLLIYDYMSNGSLEDAMRRVGEEGLELGWESRLRIAVGVIKGLRYLHFECYPQVLHYNVKTSNVMLDAEFRARLADCGLAKLPVISNQMNSGYSAPECLQNSRYTDKSDVFGFGVVLGVLVTGKHPTDPIFGEAASGGTMGRWLKHMQQAGEAKEAIDKRILGEEVEEDEMVMAVRIAVVCLSEHPADRPSSDELVPMLAQLHSF